MSVSAVIDVARRNLSRSGVRAVKCLSFCVDLAGTALIYPVSPVPRSGVWTPPVA